MEHEGDDVLEWEWPAAREPAAPSAPRRRELLRLGPLAVPVAAVAWALSLSAHGALLAVALAVWRAGPRGTPPAIQFARGDGGAGFGMYRAGKAGVDSADLVPLTVSP